MQETKHFPLILLATVCLTYFVENFLRSAAGALTPILINELGISHASMGMLVSAYFFVYGVMQIPSGILSETLGIKKTIVFFTAITIIGVFLFWISESYNLLFTAQFLVGIGSSVFYINAVKLVSTWFPKNRRATAIGILSAASGLGNFVAYMGFPVALEWFGNWRTLYFVMCVFLVLGWIMNIIVIKEREQQQPTTILSRGNSIRDLILSGLKDRRIYPFILGFILSSSSWVFMTWMPQFLIDVKGFSYVQVGQIASVGTIAGIPGCIAVAAISDRLRKRKLPLILFSATYAVLLSLFLYLPVQTPIIVFSVLSFMINFALSFWVLYFSMIPETVPLEKAGIALGIVNGMGTIGFSLLTPIYGRFVDITGQYATSNLIILVAAFLMPVVFTLYIKECYGGINEN